MAMNRNRISTTLKISLNLCQVVRGGETLADALGAAVASAAFGALVSRWFPFIGLFPEISTVRTEVDFDCLSSVQNATPVRLTVYIKPELGAIDNRSANIVTSEEEWQKRTERAFKRVPRPISRRRENRRKDVSDHEDLMRNDEVWHRQIGAPRRHHGREADWRLKGID